MKKLKILMVTSLFPNSEFPTLGVFCAERAKFLARHADVRIMAPVPYFPTWLPFGTWGKWARVERYATLDGRKVSYPKYVAVPKMPAVHRSKTMTQSVLKEYQREYADWKPDIIDGHFAFPDGFAAIQLAQAIGRPGTVTCHGSDLLEYPAGFGIAPKMHWTFRQASKVVCVSPALQEQAIQLGCPRKIRCSSPTA